MTQPSRWGFARIARMAAAGLAVVLFGAGRLAAQGTTGKIEGVVREPSGAPISGAQIRIVGSAFAATTNEQGYYYINNVSAGVKVIRGQYIGYAPAEVRNVRVLADQTLTVNLTLEQRAVEVTGITITVQENPIVPRDQVTSRAIYQGEALEALPIDNVAQLVAIQPGVVSGARGLTIRGGRPGEAATYIDGVLVRNFSAAFGNAGAGAGGAGNGTPTLRSGEVGANALEQASVTTGAIGAEYGEAQSGVIALVTRAGGQNFRGSLSYSTDEMAGKTYGQGTNRIEASFGGPLARNLTFFLGTTLQGQQSARLGKGWEDVPIYVLNGIDTTVTAPLSPGSATSDSVLVALPSFTRYSTGARRPNDAGDEITLDAKLQYSYGTGSRLSLTMHRNRDQDRQFDAQHLYNPEAQRGLRHNSSAFILNWTQTLSSRGNFFVEANASWQRDFTISGFIDPQWREDHYSPFAWITPSSMQFMINEDNFPIDDALITNLRMSNCQIPPRIAGGPGPCIPYENRSDMYNAAPYRANPYGISAGPTYFPQSGLYINGVESGTITMARETRLTGRVNFDWQANRYHRFRFGGDLMRVDMLNFTSGLGNRFNLDAYHEKPIKLALFAQDRLDLGDVVVEFGVRYDRLDSRILYPRTPGSVFTDPIREGDLASALTAEDTTVATRCAQLQAAADTVGWSTCNFFQASPRSRLSPTLRVSFPVTDRTGFRLSYSQQIQTPDFAQLASFNNTDLSVSNTNRFWARDLDFGKSIIFEFGIRHAFSQDMVLDVSAYNKDKVSDITARIVPVRDPGRATFNNINLLTNADFGNVRGLDLKLDRRFGNVFQGSLVYTYQTARSTGSDPYEYINGPGRQISNVTGERVPPAQALLTTRDNRTHTIAGSLALTFPHAWHSGAMEGGVLQDMGFFATFRFASGLPYTRVENAGQGSRGPGNGFGLVATGLETLNSSNLPWIKNVDLRVTRSLRIGSRDLTVFADFRNIFNWTNLAQIYAETGDIVNEDFRHRQVNDVIATLSNEAGSLVETRDVGGQQLSGINLSDCSLYPYGAGGSGGVPNCFMLARAEARFGDGDRFFDSQEQTSAFNAWYNLSNGPQTLKGAGFNLRIGFDLNF